MSGFSAPHCGSLRASDEGRELELYGWVARRRDHGGLIFIDLRDRWGTVQVVFNPAHAPQAHTTASDLRSEFVVRVEGKVARRRSGAENPRMPTGEVEVAASDLEVISVAKTPPFAIEDDVEADEALRLKYRYLDIRRPKMTQNLELRHRVVQAIHRYMDAHEFMEVETPMLLKGTPEGSRDFIVPSRLHPGEFFALPQSPQQLKQLLMVAGIGRYYQIARCLRDEDLRADRVVEITQLDVEMSFCTEEDVFELIEGLWAKVWKDVLGIDIPTPFRRIDMQESLLKYGTDKPDLRFELEIADVSDALRETGATVLRGALDAGGVVRCFAVPGGKDMSRRELDDLAVLARGAGAKGLAWVPGPLDRHLSEGEMAAIKSAAGAGAGLACWVCAVVVGAGGGACARAAAAALRAATRLAATFACARASAAACAAASRSRAARAAAAAASRACAAASSRRCRNRSCACSSEICVRTDASRRCRRASPRSTLRRVCAISATERRACTRSACSAATAVCTR